MNSSSQEHAQQSALYWMPIASAPKDGTVIDLWRARYVLPDPTRPEVREEGQRITNCYWRDGPNGCWIAKNLDNDGGMIVEHNNEWKVTHWMELPEVPSSSAIRTSMEFLG